MTGFLPGAERVIQLYTDALASSADEAGLELSLDDRKLLSQRLVDFADRHCSPQRAYEFEGNHASLFSKYKMEAASKKRAADGTLTEPPSKKAAADAAQVSAASVPINQPAGATQSHSCFLRNCVQLTHNLLA